MAVVHVPELVVLMSEFRGQEFMITFWACDECSDFETGFYVPEIGCPVLGPTIADEYVWLRGNPFAKGAK